MPLLTGVTELQGELEVGPTLLSLVYSVGEANEAQPVGHLSCFTFCVLTSGLWSNPFTALSFQCLGSVKVEESSCLSKKPEVSYFANWLEVQRIQKACFTEAHIYSLSAENWMAEDNLCPTFDAKYFGTWWNKPGRLAAKRSNLFILKCISFPSV